MIVSCVDPAVSIISFNPTQVLSNKTFQIKKELFKNNIRHHPLTKWFFNNFTQLEKEEIRTDWYSEMETKQQNNFFFDWFRTCHPKNILVSLKISKKWTIVTQPKKILLLNKYSLQTKWSSTHLRLVFTFHLPLNLYLHLRRENHMIFTWACPMRLWHLLMS